MKIRYIDIFLLNKILNKYSSYYANKALLTYNLNSLLFLNKFLLSYFFLDYNIFAQCKKSMYKIFKFSLFFIILNFLALKKFNKYKLIYIYTYYIEYFLYFRRILLLYVELLRVNEEVFIADKISLASLNTNLCFNGISDIDTLNFLLKNKVRLIFNFNNSLSRVFLHKVADYDICIINMFFCNSLLQYIFLHFLYYLREGIFYQKVLLLI
jgi:hypothetical protein